MLRQKETKALWENYWQLRQTSMQNPNGKIRAVKAAFQIVKELAEQSQQPVRIIELGCGEGHILAELLNICAANNILTKECVGIDNQPGVIARARQLHPQICFLTADYSSQPLNLKPFDLVMLVGTLHEVYSSNHSIALGEIDHSLGKKAVKNALCHSAHLVKDNKYLVLLDGVEHSLSPDFQITIKFQSMYALDEFKKFASEYEAIRIAYEELTPGDRIRISIRHFTRYITKTRFFNSGVWEIEKRESYQYFTEDEFEKYLGELGFKVLTLESSPLNETEWRNRIRIETSGVDLPKENILIVGRRASSNK